jgi:cytoskeletal protein CcmA (bactofilin family)
MPLWSKLEGGEGWTAAPGAEPPSPAARKAADADAEDAGDLLLGTGIRFEGKLRFAGTVRVDATFKGSIETRDVLLVGEHARIEADISCGTIVVEGEVIGSVTASTAVELRPGARVRGDLHTPALEIQPGALFDGSSSMPGPEDDDRTASADTDAYGLSAGASGDAMGAGE